MRSITLHVGSTRREQTKIRRKRRILIVSINGYGEKSLQVHQSIPFVVVEAGIINVDANVGGAAVDDDGFGDDDVTDGCCCFFK